jgi:hypothetical protein
MGSPTDRTWYNALVDDAGTGTTGTIWNKAQINSEITAVDTALAPLVTGPASSTTGDLPRFGDTTGKLLADSGVLAANVVQNTYASVVAANIPAFFDTSGRTLYDSTVAIMATAAAVPFNAANFAAASGTWTITAGQVSANGYYRIGRFIVWSVSIASGSTLSVASANLQMTLPVGPVTYPGSTNVYLAGAAGLPTQIQTLAGSSIAYLQYNNGATNWPSGSLPALVFTLPYLL